MPMLEVKNIKKNFGDTEVLKNISLRIDDGEAVCIIGPSGSGKSTFLRCLNLLETPTGGHIYYNDTLLEPELDAKRLHREVGMVFQKYNPFPKSIYENIVFPLRVAGRNRRAELDETVERSLKGAALWDEVKDKLHESAYGLSGGQQQRLCIARAIANRPQILLMDEPCAALDPIATLKIEDLMEDLKKDLTIVIVTHEMSVIRRICNRVALLDDGHLVEVVQVENKQLHPQSVVGQELVRED